VRVSTRDRSSFESPVSNPATNVSRAVFTWYEKRKERRGETPLITIRLFRRRAVSVGLLVVVVLYSGIVGFWLAFAIFLQIGLGYTPIQSAPLVIAINRGSSQRNVAVFAVRRRRAFSAQHVE
jgi:hypothetical protein